jgi:hypothetical protein
MEDESIYHSEVLVWNSGRACKTLVGYVQYCTVPVQVLYSTYVRSSAMLLLSVHTKH